MPLMAWRPDREELFFARRRRRHPGNRRQPGPPRIFGLRSCARDGTGWAAGNNGTIIKTTNGGTTWQTCTSGTNNWIGAVDFVDSQTGWAVGNERHNSENVRWGQQLERPSSALARPCRDFRRSRPSASRGGGESVRMIPSSKTRPPASPVATAACAGPCRLPAEPCPGCSTPCRAPGRCTAGSFRSRRLRLLGERAPGTSSAETPRSGTWPSWTIRPSAAPRRPARQYAQNGLQLGNHLGHRLLPVARLLGHHLPEHRVQFGGHFGPGLADRGDRVLAVRDQDLHERLAGIRRTGRSAGGKACSPACRCRPAGPRCGISKACSGDM